jgi:hypothetical protein
MNTNSIEFQENNTEEFNKFQLIADYNNCISRGIDSYSYSFLRVLSSMEKKRFINKMDSDMIMYFYKMRSIKTMDWFKILDNILLESEYYIYRKSYWCENAGRTEVSKFKSSTITLIRIILGEKNDNTPKIKKMRINLLIEDNYVKIINKIKPASWTNHKYLLDSTEDEIM